MFFAEHVAFLVRILVRKCKKSKKVKKPFVFPEKNFSNTKMKNKKIETLYFKAFWQSAIAIGGRATMMLLHALCVFLCTPLFEPKWEPLEETSVREKN